MESNYIQQIQALFKNVILNSTGVERDFYKLINSRDIDKAIMMMQDNTTDVDNAISEYNPQLHKIMKRRDKYAKEGKEVYVTCKLARSRQRYINECELFFLLGRNIEWRKESGDDEAYRLFTEYLKSSHFNTTMRKAKRLAGAETESAKLYHIYQNEGKTQSKVVVLSRSEGYQLRPLFDQYGTLVAFAYGYRVKSAKGDIQHWDIQTKKFLVFCKKGALGWDIETYENPTGKINVIYYNQEKAWYGVENRIEREEELDSKVGDTNNYFADPIAKATADVIETMTNPEQAGKLIQMTGKDSEFDYVDPPQSSETREAEMSNLSRSILFDTFTPDFSFENLKGLGTLSGSAIHNAMMIAYIKRDARIEIYGELVEREKNLILSVLKIEHPEMLAKLESLEIEFNFADPFPDDKKEQWSALGSLFGAGLVSLETAVAMLSLTKAPQEEIDRIRMAQVEKTMAQAELKEEKSQENGGKNINEEE